ncbi:PEPxxWA-CTERM sorting domain-containing protein [uncultured Sphingomonas sp.]|uniref:PEPxxWA-CTERM sorting domain-containing protein n=1 Tax=uncultured Sphingomonas sp. TaxID=158754 RepID=UPI0035C9634B
MKIGFAALGATLLGVTSPALAAQYTFNTTGTTLPTNSVFTDATPAPALQMKVTAWQANQSTNAITSSTLAIFSGGLGVVGTGESTSDGTHQIDNGGGYTDFVLLQFSRAVTLGQLTFNSYQLGSQTTLDNDLGWYNAGAIQTAAWNSTVNLGAYSYAGNLWSFVDNAGGASGFDNITGTTASTKWLIGAAGLSSYFTANGRASYDGFKLASITVNDVTPPAVPEPASWAMMIAGFGLVGGALRAGRRSDVRVAA